MGTDEDEGSVFTHELSHAIDHILPDFEYEASYTELIAELSAIVLCRTYNISIDIPYSLYYLRGYTNNKTNMHKVINRVALIYEAVKEIKKAIEGRNNDA
jgi:antirestriction protein ArdC